MFATLENARLELQQNEKDPPGFPPSKATVKAEPNRQLYLQIGQLYPLSVFRGAANGVIRVCERLPR